MQKLKIKANEYSISISRSEKVFGTREADRDEEEREGLKNAESETVQPDRTCEIPTPEDILL